MFSVSFCLCVHLGVSALQPQHWLLLQSSLGLGFSTFQTQFMLHLILVQPKRRQHKCSLQQLRGVQRVPTLLLNNPTQLLDELNLQDYTILDCEPLQDMKGHSQNLVDEVQHILNKQLADDSKKLINTNLKKQDWS